MTISGPPVLGFVLVAFFVAFTVWCLLGVRKRRQEMAAAAQRIGFNFLGETWQGLVLNPRFKTWLLQRGHARADNVMVGVSGSFEVTVFDYTYTTQDNSDQFRSISQTIACFSHTVELPPFTLEAENVLTRIGNAILHNDIDFESHPAFSRRYALKSPDEAGTRRLFTPAVLTEMEQISSEAPWNIETSGINLFLYRAGRVVSPSSLATFLQETSAIATVIFNSEGLKNPVA